MNQQPRKIERETFFVRVTTNLDGHKGIEFLIPNILKSEEQEDSSPSASAEESEAQLEGFARKPLPKEEVSKRLRSLSKQWTSTAIGFLEIVPALTGSNFKFAHDGMVAKILEHAKSESLGSVEGKTDDGLRYEEFELPIEELILIADLSESDLINFRAVSTMAKAGFSALVSEYEDFLTNLLRTMGRQNPSLFISDSESISVKDLEKYSSFNDFMEDLIDEKVTDLLHSKTHVQVLKWIEGKFSVNLTSDKNLINDFVEICQRRHLLAHAGGVANKRYAKICEEQGVSKEKMLKIGDRVSVSKRDLRRATACIYRVGYFTLHILWQKVLPAERGNSLGAILDDSHEFLKQDLTKMARRNCEFALASRESISASIRSSLVINIALSELHSQDHDEDDVRERVEKILGQHDWSVTDPLLRLALACVRREYEDLDALTKQAVADGLSFKDAMTWVIFREVRKKNEFLENLKRPSATE